jgi:hypothetical protein
MRKRKLWLYGVSALALAATVPWTFVGEGARLWGFPSWAVYSLAASVVYAALIAALLGSGWEESARGPEWWKDEDSADRDGR